MSYTYYREHPGWGTQQYQFAPPPAPTFRPEATWRGRDYYSAATASPDLTVFDNAYNSVRAGGANLGVGFRDARSAHRRAYGGLGDSSMLLPHELGAAAAYEAYRTWIHNSSVFEPARFDDERQREALIGLAMAEATRLWHSTGRRLDRFGMQQACEAAAATAGIIMGQWQDPYTGATAGTPPSPYVGPGSAVSSFDPYAYDEAAYRSLLGGHHHHPHPHHRRSPSSSSTPPAIVHIANPSSAMPIPAPAAPAGGYGVPFVASTAPVPMSAPISIGAPQGVASPYGGSAMPLSASPYGPTTTAATTTYVNTVPQGMYGSAQQAGYPSSLPSTLVIPPPSSHRHHHHGHRSHSHEREREREQRHREREREREEKERRREREERERRREKEEKERRREKEEKERRREKEREKEMRRARRYSDAGAYHYGQQLQPQPQHHGGLRGVLGGFGGGRSMGSGGFAGTSLGAPPIAAPSYTTAYRY